MAEIWKFNCGALIVDGDKVDEVEKRGGDVENSVR